ncbi:hypothetical protein DFH11DRAFT_1645365 [Phellopilus nigrolimitatus]|nr:hypothetical protein DFH11DRAFT_1645365 [Phellopilus nigrolimitatus]
MHVPVVLIILLVLFLTANIRLLFIVCVLCICAGLANRFRNASRKMCSLISIYCFSGVYSVISLFSILDIYSLS